ncbi:MAG: putative Ig domain-containing protein [Acidobacteria bacterium]|nr:putative Ig domain-containing protein [Acidobacteriota bacterium]
MFFGLAVPGFAQLTITNSTLPPAMVNRSYSVTFTTTGGTAPITLDMFPAGQALPTGVSFGSGTLSGTPISTVGSPFSVSIRATDSTIPTPSTTTKGFTLTVLPELTFTPASLPNATAGQAYSQQVTATGGAGPYTYSATGLPANLTINTSTGLISGTPTSAGTTTGIVVTVGDSSTPQFVTSRTYSLTVNAGSGPTISTSSPLPQATLGRAYSQQLAATGGTGTITYAPAPGSGAFPNGIGLSSSGLISGTPTGATAASFTVRATDSGAQFSDKTFALTVNGVPAITTSSLPVGVVSSAYSTQLAATGGTAPLTWTVTSGTLFSGLTFNTGTGAITGTPTASGTQSMGFQVTDANGASASVSLPFSINPALSITTASPLPAGTVNSPYTQALAATGGASSSYVWTMPTGSLPANMQMSTLGVISGTPTAATTANFKARVTDINNNFVEKDFSLTINTSTSTLAISTSTLPNGSVGSTYNQTLAATGGSGTGYNWTVETGPLPGGLTLSTAGVLSGLLTTAGTTSFTVRVTDSQSNTITKSLSLTVTSGFSITTTTVPNWTVGVNYSQTLLTSGGTSPFAWAVTIGSLPPGITLGQLNGTLSGIPTTPGSYSFTVQATESGTTTATRQLSITINAAPSLGPTTLPNGVLSTSYSASLTASSGTAPFTYTVTQGALPGGLTLASGTGVISGSPTAAGNFTFTVMATDFAGATASRQYTVNVASSVLSISTTTLSNAVLNFSYSAQLQVSGGTSPYTFLITTGSLPAGLTMTNGLISGAPTTVGSSTFTVQVTDSAQNTASRSFTLTVIGSGLVVTTQSLPQAVVNQVYTTSLSASGGSGSGYTWTLAAGSNALPTGIVLGTSGILSGTATTTSTTTITVQVADSVGTVASKQFILSVVANPLTITTNSPLQDASQSLSYTATLQASGGTGINYSFTVIGGSLPPGVNLSPNGTMTGTPTAAGSFQFTIQVTDSGGGAATKPFTLSVIAPNLTITTQSLPAAATGQSYSATVAASGGTAPYTFSITVGALPTGLSLNSTTGAITGTPTAQGGFNFIVQVRDANQLTNTANLSIQVVTFGITTDVLPNAAVGVAYSAALGTLGGTPPLTWSISAGSLPAGISLGSSTGTLTGTANSAGTATFTVRVQDAGSNVATRQFQLTVTTGLTITTQSLPNGTVGVGYQQTLQGSGGTAPFTWSVTSGALPVGLSLNGGTGVISGTPNTTIGSPYTFVIRLRDSTNAQTEKQFTITIAGSSGGPAISTASLPNATPGVAYSQSLTATGGTTPYTWSVTGGILPSGFTLTPQGVLAGSPSQGQIGVYPITVQVTDAGGLTATKQLQLTIANSNTLTVVTSALNATNVGVQYVQTLAASGGSGAGYIWQLAAGSGSLPPGLNMSSNGVISGTALTAGSFNFTVQVNDSAGATATRQLSITVTAVLTVATTSVPNATLNATYPAYSLQAVGGTGNYNWLVIGGALPQGLSLTPSGVLTGIPTVTGTFNFTVRLTDTQTSNTATKDLSITVQAGGTLSITTESVPAVGLGIAYVFAFQAVGGQAPYTWTVVNGALPQGLTLATNGVLSGTTAATGTYPITLQVRDNLNLTTQKLFSIPVGSSGLTILTPSLPAATLNNTYTFALAASGGTAPYTWSILSGQLPTGMSLTPNTGVMTGTPTAAGTYTLFFQVADNTGATTNKSLTLQVIAGLTINTTSLANGQTGVSYNQTLSASGGVNTGFVWSIISGSLPQGLTLSTAGVISGVPAVNGTSTFTVQVTDGAGATATRQLSIQIGAALTISPDTLPGGSVGTAYSQALTASGATGALTWSVSSGALPGGVTLGAGTGLLSGTPTAAGSFNFTVRVQDANNAAATKAYSVVIGEGLTITTASPLPAASENVAYSQTLATAGGTAPFSWSLSVGSLPPGLTLNTNSGVISGTPTTAGNYSFIVQVRDARQVSGQKAFTLLVGGRIAITTPATLPNATIRTPYSETLIAAAGIGPYTWSLAPGGIPPLGMTVDRDGVLSGTPTNAGTFTFTVQVTDSAGASASRTFTLTVQQALSITTASPLPAAIAGSAYAQAMAAAGGLAPYTWSLASGALPAGISLSQTGILSGTPTASGTFTFAVQVVDSNRATVSSTYSMIVRLPSAPVFTITGLPETITPAQQPRLTLGIGAAYPVPITGTLTMTFTPDATNPADDPAVAFSSGGRTLNFTVPANATDAQLPPGFAMQTGTVSGEIKLALTLRASGTDITPSPAPTVVGRVAKAAPVIRSVTARRVASGLEVVITGFSTTRDISSATFRFSPAPGSSLQTSELTVQLTDGARTWYQSEGSRAFGSQFTLTQQFNVQGDTSAIASVSVTLTNTSGTSAAGTANF